MTSFTEMFPEIVEEGKKLYPIFSQIASVVIFAGLVQSATGGTLGDPGKAIRAVLSAALLILLIGMFPRLTDLAQQIAFSVVEEVGADPSQAHQEFAKLVAGPGVDGSEGVGFWDVLWDSNGGIGKSILYAVLLLMSKIALAVMWLAFLVQKVVITIGVAIAPVFIGMLALECTKGIAGRFFLSLLSSVCWPIGWALASIVTRGLLRMAAGNDIYSASGEWDVSVGTEILFFIVVLSLWILGSTIAAPLAISKLLTTGAQVGASLIQANVAAGSQGASYAIGGAVTATMAGGGKGAAAMASAVGGVGGAVSGAMGSSGVIIPAAIGTMAVLASSPSSDIETEDRADKIRKSS